MKMWLTPPSGQPGDDRKQPIVIDVDADTEWVRVAWVIIELQDIAGFKNTRCVLAPGALTQAPQRENLTAKQLQELVFAATSDHPDPRAVHHVLTLGPAAVKPLVKLLSPRILEGEPARQLLIRIGAPAVPNLIEALAQGEGLADEIARVLGHIRDAKAVDPLIALLQSADSDPSGRAAAAWALGQLGDRRAVPALIASLRSADRTVRDEAAKSLGNLGDVRAIPPLEKAEAEFGPGDGHIRNALRKLRAAAPATQPDAQPVDSEADAKAREMVARLSNSDVKWTGDWIGVRPEIIGQPAKDILALGRPALTALLSALQEQGKFAAAHVLLTRIAEQGFVYDRAGEWNGLHVTLTADNRTVFHPEQIPALIKQWRPAADGSLLTDRLAEQRLMMEISLRRVPKDWEGFGRQAGVVEPLYWEPGEGVVFRWQRKGFKPLDWKQPVDGKIRGGEVRLWIMQAGYAPKEARHLEAATGPAGEIATWRGRRVFFWGGGDDWPTARADILAALKATDAPAAETQPASSPSTQPASAPAAGDAQWFKQHLAHFDESFANYAKSWSAEPKLPADSQYASKSVEELARIIVQHGNAPWDGMEQVNAFLAKTKDKPEARRALAAALLTKIDEIRAAGKWSVCLYQHGQWHALLWLGDRPSVLKLMEGERLATCCGNDALMMRVVAFGQPEDAWPLLRHFAKDGAEGWLDWLNGCMVRLTGAKAIPPGAITDKPYDEAFRRQAVKAWADYLVRAGIKPPQPTTAPAPTSRPSPTTQPAKAVYPTLEEAAIAAWEFETDLPSEQRPGPGKDEFDRPATIRLMKSKAYEIFKTQIDLNGDGVDEILLANGRFVGKNGKETTFDGAQNRSWAVLQKVAGGWRVVGSGFGSPCPPLVLKDSTNGWKDLESGHHNSAASGTSYLYQFDGKRYVLTEQTEYDHRPARPATQPAKALLDEQPVDGLGKFLVIREQAPSLAELVAKAKPDFTFGDDGRDMMWIDGKDTARPSFRLEHAFVYQPPGRPANFVLLKSLFEGGPGDDAHTLVECLGPPAVAKLHDERPIHDGGSGQYAIVKSRGPDGAVLYEIGWQSGYGPNWWKERRLFVLRIGEQWKFVGEGPAESDWKTGYCQGAGTDVNARVEWTARADAPVRIHFVVTDVEIEWASSDMLQEDPTAGDAMRAYLEKRLEWILEGKLPAALRKVTDRPYMLARPGDTFDKVVRHLSSWTQGRQDNAPKVEAIWKRELSRLNPDLPTGKIPEGRRINLPTDAELGELLNPGTPATQPTAESVPASSPATEPAREAVSPVPPPFVPLD